MSPAISLFVTIPVIYSGFKGVEVDQIKLARTFGASKAQILTKAILPDSIPTMIAALKVNAGLRHHRLGRKAHHRPAIAGDIRPANPVVMRLCQLRLAPTRITRPTESRADMSERLETLRKARERMTDDRDAFAKTLAAPFDREKAERARIKFIETQVLIDAIDRAIEGERTGAA
jgi:Binding-protein-dependent transport system inner membrane component